MPCSGSRVIIDSNPARPSGPMFSESQLSPRGVVRVDVPSEQQAKALNLWSPRPEGKGEAGILGACSWPRAAVGARLRVLGFPV